MLTLTGSVEREGLCPRCNGPAVYRYKLEAPAEDPGGPAARLSYEVSCLACGFKESRRVVMPLDVAYMVRYILDPSLRGVLERAKLIADMGGAAAVAQRESARA